MNVQIDGPNPKTFLPSLNTVVSLCDNVGESPNALVLLDIIPRDEMLKRDGTRNE